MRIAKTAGVNALRLFASSLAIAVIGSGLPARDLDAQMPSVPVLQNGFVSSGMTLAINYGSTSASNAYAMAAADRFGVALFAGVGGARRDTTSTVRVPVGVGAGYRFGLGATRSVAAYASPFFVWSRLSERGARAQADNAMRGSVAVDLVLTRNVGLTAGYEFGSGKSASSLSGSSGLFGAAASYAFR
jgi:hypothetical protein